MDIKVQRKIDRNIGSLICRLFSLLPAKKPDFPASSNYPKQILVILLSEMGSLVLAKPMFDRIAEKYPDAAVHALIFSRNREVLELLDTVDRNHIYTIRDENLFVMAKDSLLALRNMRQSGIDTVIDCELFSRISSIYSFLSGAAIRCGFHPHTMEGLYRGSFINRPVLYNPYLHISRQFVNLVEAIENAGAPIVKREIEDDAFPLPQLQITEEEKKKMADRLQHDFPQIVSDRLVLIYPGGGLLPIRAWPVKYYCRMAVSLNDAGYHIGIIGMSNDTQLADHIRRQCHPEMSANLAGYTRTVRELVVLFHLSRILITNDGGPGHFASLTPIPSIIFYGPETPILYGPLARNTFSFFQGISCSPCLTAYNHRNTPCDGNNVCLKTISPDTVLEKVHELLAQKDS